MAGKCCSDTKHHLSSFGDMHHLPSHQYGRTRPRDQGLRSALLTSNPNRVLFPKHDLRVISLYVCRKHSTRASLESRTSRDHIAINVTFTRQWLPG